MVRQSVGCDCGVLALQKRSERAEHSRERPVLPPNPGCAGISGDRELTPTARAESSASRPFLLHTANELVPSFKSELDSRPIMAGGFTPDSHNDGSCRATDHAAAAPFASRGSRPMR